jgi:hypothetical protein
MGLRNKLIEHKTEFYHIFNEAIKRDGDFITSGGKLSHDDLIDSHLIAWIESRINGGSSSMVFYAEEVEAIKLIDKLAKEYFG